jgi:hypothetical protein
MLNYQIATYFKKNPCGDVRARAIVTSVEKKEQTFRLSSVSFARTRQHPAMCLHQSKVRPALAAFSSSSYDSFHVFFSVLLFHFLFVLFLFKFFIFICNISFFISFSYFFIYSYSEQR